MGIQSHWMGAVVCQEFRNSQGHRTDWVLTWHNTMCRTSLAFFFLLNPLFSKAHRTSQNAAGFHAVPCRLRCNIHNILCHFKHVCMANRSGKIDQVVGWWWWWPSEVHCWDSTSRHAHGRQPGRFCSTSGVRSLCDGLFARWDLASRKQHEVRPKIGWAASSFDGVSLIMSSCKHSCNISIIWMYLRSFEATCGSPCVSVCMLGWWCNDEDMTSMHGMIGTAITVSHRMMTCLRPGRATAKVWWSQSTLKDGNLFQDVLRARCKQDVESKHSRKPQAAASLLNKLNSLLDAVGPCLCSYRRCQVQVRFHSSHQELSTMSCALSRCWRKSARTWQRSS